MGLMPMHNPILSVHSDRSDSRRGRAKLADGRSFACALGKAGARADKREGDGASPLGRFGLRQVLYRPDREPIPQTGLPVRALTPADGWCDDPAVGDYNGMVRLPCPHRHERLWREDHVYDLIVVVGYNDAPVIAGHGSAIFLHLAREDYAPTEGCIAFSREDLLAILKELGPDSMVIIEAPQDPSS
jgi:L,D-peptidoglycan transpeptidase YkuD (ErfK/YbiS/YcfS/YnhG family)